MASIQGQQSRMTGSGLAGANKIQTGLRETDQFLPLGPFPTLLGPFLTEPLPADSVEPCPPARHHNGCHVKMRQGSGETREGHPLTPPALYVGPP